MITLLLAPLLVALAKLFGMANARMGTVDLFKHEIWSLCRTISETNMIRYFAILAVKPLTVTIPTDFGKENFYQIFEANSKELSLLLGEDQVSYVTQFYTFLKSSREQFRRFHPWEQSEYPILVRQVDIRNMIYLLLRCIESAQKALCGLVDNGEEDIDYKSVLQETLVRAYAVLFLIPFQNGWQRQEQESDRYLRNFMGISYDGKQNRYLLKDENIFGFYLDEVAEYWIDCHSMGLYNRLYNQLYDSYKQQKQQKELQDGISSDETIAMIETIVTNLVVKYRSYAQSEILKKIKDIIQEVRELRMTKQLFNRSFGINKELSNLLESFLLESFLERVRQTVVSGDVQRLMKMLESSNLDFCRDIAAGAGSSQSGGTLTT